MREGMKEHLRAVALGGSELWRKSRRIEDVATRQIQRKAQREDAAFLDLGYAFQNLLRRQKIEAAKLIVLAKIPPIRTFGSPLPARAHSQLRFRFQDVCLV
jgi:hypothetical protein